MRHRHMVMFFLLVVECLSLTAKAWSQSEGRPCKPGINPLAYGDLISCQVNTSNTSQFSGKVGEVIHLQFCHAGGQLLDPDGLLISAADVGACGIKPTLNQKLNKTGMYTVKFTPEQYTPGSYTLSLERIVPPSPSVPTLPLGKILDGEINPQGDVDYYTFNGYVGDTVTIRIELLSGNEFDEILYDPPAWESRLAPHLPAARDGMSHTETSR